MSKVEFALQSSLMLAIVTHGFGNAQTRTVPKGDAVSTQERRTTQSQGSQTEVPIEEYVDRYKEQNSFMEPSPNDAKKFYRQGVMYVKMKLYNEALAAFELAVLLKPNYKDAYFGLGDTYSNMGRWKKAIHAFRRVIQLNPKDDKAYARLREINARLLSEEKAGFPTKRSVVRNNTPAAERVSLASGSQSNIANRSNPKLANRISDTAQRESAYSPIKQSASQPPKATADARSKATATRSGERSLTSSNASPNTPRSISSKAMSESNSGSNTTLSRGSAAALNPVSNTGSAQEKNTKVVTKPIPTSFPGSGAPLNTVSRSESNPGKSPNTVKNSVPNVTVKKNVETASATSTNSGFAMTAATTTGIKQPDIAVSKTSPKTGSVSEAVSVRPSAGIPESVTPIAKEPDVPTKTVSAVVSNSGLSSSLAATESSEVAIYRLGVGDVLDVRVTDSPLDTPTLFTVSAGGLLDYPILPQPLNVLGLTTDEVGEKLSNELKRLALSEGRKVIVAVSAYNSHAILVSGLVKEHGTKLLRREAIPLYVVLAEAQLLPEAQSVTVISREGSKTTNVDLANSEATALLIRPGDVVVVRANSKLFFYIGGDVKEPGEKPFRHGLKLTQAILLAGGLTRVSKAVELTREGTNGLLKLSIYKLHDINTGKLPDPSIQPGDRITIVH